MHPQQTPKTLQYEKIPGRPKEKQLQGPGFYFSPVRIGTKQGAGNKHSNE